ncbi:MAG: hypothetical protein IKJ89_09520, partial [Kiritimatiellae bacterium]|nr:hypothetical protein [Kiritimatiellia bacterium]
MLLASLVFAVGDGAGSRKSDAPGKRLTAEEIIAAPRPKTMKVGVPIDTGVYIGSGVYSNKGKMKNSGFCFTYWEPEKLDYDEIIDLCVKEGVG